jgi:uncharacterized protein YkwD
MAAVALVTIDVAGAEAHTSARSAFISDTNHARDHHDRRDYRVKDDLMRVAQRWANWMAAHHSLRHNPYLGSQVHGWQSLGENVGKGGSESAIQHAFMNSTGHRDNILSRDFRQVGIGAARGSDGRLYVDEVFRTPR